MTTMTTARPRATGHPGFSETHPRTEATVPGARLLVQHALSLWGLDEYAETAALVLSELVTNAVRHAHGPSIRIIVDRTADWRVYLAVVDRAPRQLPVLREPGEEETGGRGLLLMDAFADRWGYDLLGDHQHPWGKRAFAELEIKQ